MTELTFRDINHEDLGIVLEMIKELAIDEGRPQAVTISKDHLAALLFGKKAIAHGLIAVAGEIIVGYALLVLKFSSFKGYRIAYIEDVLIRPAYRSAGFGRQIMTAVAEKALALDCQSLEWSALDTNLEAIGFYDHIGAGREQGRIHFEMDYRALKSCAEETYE